MLNARPCVAPMLVLMVSRLLSRQDALKSLPYLCQKAVLV